eukprot:TRINITY_DN1706_c0_g1_i4.p1 TRINITY_DN1706_c0_g1~~TRINITY_DN1706_c0_g1_i4.p1  ORF type:complete len:573 (+),score=190.14 TRINITY_DN1706_c0_g1_i4:577-2295(+)
MIQDLQDQIFARDNGLVILQKENADLTQLLESQKSIAHENLKHQLDLLKDKMEREEEQRRTEHTQELVQLNDKLKAVEEKASKFKNLVSLTNEKLSLQKTKAAHAIHDLQEAIHARDSAINARDVANQAREASDKLNSSLKRKIASLQKEIQDKQKELDEQAQEHRNYKVKVHAALKAKGTPRRTPAAGGDGTEEETPLELELHSALVKVRLLTAEKEDSDKSLALLHQHLQLSRQETHQLQEHYQLTVATYHQKMADLQNEAASRSLSLSQANQNLQLQLTQMDETHAKEVEDFQRKIESLNDLLSSASRDHTFIVNDLNTRIKALEEEITRKTKESSQSTVSLPAPVPTTEASPRETPSQDPSWTSGGATDTPSSGYGSISGPSHENGTTGTGTERTGSPKQNKNQSQNNSSLNGNGHTSASASGFLSDWTGEESMFPETRLVGNKAKEVQLFHFMQMHATLTDELSRARTRIQQLNELLQDSERMDSLHQMQENLLKNEIRELERAKVRSSLNLDYLKNIIVKFLETDERQAMLPVLVTLLQISPEEVQRIKVASSSRSNNSKWSLFKT